MFQFERRLPLRESRRGRVPGGERRGRRDRPIDCKVGVVGVRYRWWTLSGIIDDEKAAAPGGKAPPKVRWVRTSNPKIGGVCRHRPSASCCHKAAVEAQIMTAPRTLRTVNIIVGTKIDVMRFRQ